MSLKGGSTMKTITLLLLITVLSVSLTNAASDKDIYFATEIFVSFEDKPKKANNTLPESDFDFHFLADKAGAGLKEEKRSCLVYQFSHYFTNLVVAFIGDAVTPPLRHVVLRPNDYLLFLIKNKKFTYILNDKVVEVPRKECGFLVRFRLQYLNAVSNDEFFDVPAELFLSVSAKVGDSVYKSLFEKSYLQIFNRPLNPKENEDLRKIIGITVIKNSDFLSSFLKDKTSCGPDWILREDLYQIHPTNFVSSFSKPDSFPIKNISKYPAKFIDYIDCSKNDITYFVLPITKNLLNNVIEEKNKLLQAQQKKQEENAEKLKNMFNKNTVPVNKGKRPPMSVKK